MSDFKYSLDIDVRNKGIQETRKELEKLKQELASAQKDDKKIDFVKENFGNSFKSGKELKTTIEQVEKALDKLEKKGKDLTIADLAKFNDDLRKIGVKITSLDKYLTKAGNTGVQAIGKITNTTYDLGIQVDRVNDKLSKLGGDIQHEVIDNIVASGFNAMGGAIDRAIYFTKDLDRSLTDIQIVSGKSASEMEAFAQNANDAARALGSTTDEFAQSSLIFYQQGGYTEQEVRKLAEATTIASNITRQATDVVADQLTSLINAFGVQVDEVMPQVVDVFAQIGAVSGSNFEELATATQKFASQAKTAGYEGAKGIQEMGAQLAVVVETTRQSADSVGVGFKTILSRIQGITEDKTGEMVSKLRKSFGQLNSELKALGGTQVEVFNEFGELKGADEIIDSLGNAWSKYGDKLTTATKQYVLQEVAGVEQSSRLAALLDNWDRYIEILDEAQQAEGVALQQQAIYMDSIDAKAAELRTNFEAIVMALNVDDILKSFYEGMINISEVVLDITENTADLGESFASAMGFSEELGETLGAWAPIVGVASAAFSKFGATLVSSRLAMGSVQKDYVKALTEDLKTAEGTISKIKTSQREIAQYSGVQEAEKYARLQDKIAEIEQKKLDILTHIEKIKRESFEEIAKRNPHLKGELDIYNKQIVVLRACKSALKDMGKENADIIQIAKSMNDELKEQIELNKILEDKATSREQKEQKILEVLEQQKNSVRAKKSNAEENIRSEGDATQLSAVLEAEKQAEALNKTGEAYKRTTLAIEEETKALKIVKGALGAVTTVMTAVPTLLSGINDLTDDSANKAQALSKIISGLGIAIQSLTPIIATFSATLATIAPYVGIAMIAIGGLMTVIGGIPSELDKTREANEALTKSFIEQKNHIDSMKDSIDGVKDTYIELEDAMKRGYNAQSILASGNEELIEKYLQYASVVEQVAPELIQGYDDQGRAIIDLTKGVETLTKKIKEQEQANYSMMASNAPGFITDLADKYQSASGIIKTGMEEQKKLQEELNKATENGNYNKISKLSGEMAEVNSTLVEQRQILSEFPQLINANIIQPFFKSNETMIKWNDEFKGKTVETENGIQSLSGTLNSLILNTEELYRLMQSGQTEEAVEMIKSAEIAMQVFGESVSRNGEVVDELTNKFFEMPVHMQQASLQLQGSMGENINVLEDFDNKIEGVLDGTKSMSDTFGNSSKSLDDAKDKLKDLNKELEEAEELQKTYGINAGFANQVTAEQAQLTAENVQEINRLRKEIKKYDKIVEDSGENQEFFSDMLHETVEAMEDSVDGYNTIVDSLIDVRDVIDELYEKQEAGTATDLELERLSELQGQYFQTYVSLMDEDANFYQNKILNNQAWVDAFYESTGLVATDYDNLQQLMIAAEQAGFDTRTWLMSEETRQFAENAANEVYNAQLAESEKVRASSWGTFAVIGNFGKLLDSGYEITDLIGAAFVGVGDLIVNAFTSAVNGLIGLFNGFVNTVTLGLNILIAPLSLISKAFGGPELKFDYVPMNAGFINTKSNMAGNYLDKKAQKKKNNASKDDLVLDTPIPDKKKPQSKPPSKPSSSNKKPGTKPSGGKDKDKNKGNKGDKDKKEKEVKDVELELDPLYEYEKALELVENEMGILQAKEKELFGKDLIDNLQKQNDLLNKKVQILKSEAEVIDNQMAHQRKLLSSKGFTFDESGMITNFNKVIEKLTNEANSKTGQAKEQAIADLKKIKEEVKNYDKFLTDTSAKIKEDLIKIQQEIRENYQKQIEIVVEVQLDLSKAYEKMYEFQQKFNEGFDKSSESLENMGKYAESLMGDLKTMEAAISKIANDTNLTQKQKNELLEDLIDEYMDAAENLDDVIKEMGEKITESLEEGLELIQETAEGYERIKDYASDYADLLKDIYGSAAKNDIMELYDIQIQATQESINSLKEQQKLAQSYVDSLKPGSEEWRKAKEQLNEINEELGSTTIDLLDLMREKMEDFFELSKDALEKDIFGGSLDDVKDKWDRINAQQDKYVSNAEKINKLGKLQVSIQEEIEKTNDPRKKAQLQKFIDNELKALKEKDKLTEKDVERAEKVYILMLKQQALETQQMTAMMARLVRDEAGNWSYEYVQDINKVNEAQKDLADSLEDLMNTDKENLKENQEEMLELYEQYFDDLEKLQEKAMAGGFTSPDEFNAAVDALNKQFQSQFGQLGKEQESLLNNMTNSSLANIFNMYQQNGGKLGMFSSQTEGVIGNILGSLESGNLAWTDIINGSYDKIANQLGVTQSEVQSAMKEMTDTIQKDFNESNSAIKHDYEDLSNKVNSATSDMKKAFENYFKGVSNGMNNQKDAIKDLNGALSSQKDSINKVTDAVNKEANAIKNNLIPSYNDLKNKYNKEVNPEVQSFVQKLKDSIEQMKNNTTGITGSKGLNDALDKLQREFEKSKAAADKLIGTSGTGLKGVAKEAQDAFNKITSLTGKVATSSIDSANRSVKGVGSSISGINNSLNGMSSVARNAVNGVIGQLDRIPRSKTTTITLATRDKVKMKTSMNPGNPNSHTQYLSYNGLKKSGPWNAANIGQYMTFKSGGYTGDWKKNEGLEGDKDGGKLAVLHQKEMVLNKEDTKNLLDAVRINKDLFKSVSGVPKSMFNTINNHSNGGSVIYHIDNIELPNVDNVNRFLEELQNLPNKAIQYKYSKKTY